MTEDQITRGCYAFAIGFLSVSAYGTWPGFLIGLLIVAVVILSGSLCGKDAS